MIVDTAIKSWVRPTNFAGPVQRFASLSRFIRVINPNEMFFTNGLKTVADSDDPMKAYSRQDDNLPYQAVKLRADRAAWRDAHTLFLGGIASTQAASGPKSYCAARFQWNNSKRGPSEGECGRTRD